MKTHVLIVSPVYPSTHKRKGELTYFPEKIQYQNMLQGGYEVPCLCCHLHYENSICNICHNPSKIHTIRANYELWAKRIKEVQEGKAILSIRYWVKPGGCYIKNNSQVEICQLDKDSGIGVQRISLINLNTLCVIENTRNSDAGAFNLTVIAKNDGLSLEDFKEWFRKYDLSKPLAIIHFTKFRY